MHRTATTLLDDSNESRKTGYLEDAKMELQAARQLTSKGRYAEAV